MSYRSFLLSAPGVVTMTFSGVMMSAPLAVAPPWNICSTMASCNDELTHCFSLLQLRPQFFQQGRAAFQHILPGGFKIPGIPRVGHITGAAGMVHQQRHFVLRAERVVRVLFLSSFSQIFFQKHQLNALNAIEYRRDDPNFRIAMLFVHGPCCRIPGVGINAQLRAAVFTRIGPESSWLHTPFSRCQIFSLFYHAFRH